MTLQVQKKGEMIVMKYGLKRKNSVRVVLATPQSVDIQLHMLADEIQ